MMSRHLPRSWALSARNGRQLFGSPGLRSIESQLNYPIAAMIPQQ